MDNGLSRLATIWLTQRQNDERTSTFNIWNKRRGPLSLKINDSNNNNNNNNNNMVTDTVIPLQIRCGPEGG